jgi:HlyD family secretion protein
MEVRRGLTTKTVMNQVETGKDTPTSGEDVQIRSDAPRDSQDKNARSATRIPSIIVGIVAAAVVALSVFYLLRPEPLLVQGEADATRLDIAARVDGRVKEIPVNRGQNVPAGAVLVQIDNPETLAKHEQMKAAMAVAEAQLANVLVGTRAEVIAARKAELERAQAALVLAQKTYDRTNTLTGQGNAPQARLDQMTDALHESERAVDQAKSAYDQAVNGYTKEERAIARTNVEKANADIQSVQSIIDQLQVYAPLASQVYQRNVEPGEYVSPGVPLVTLIDLADVWIHFDLREDLVKGLKVGDRFDVHIPALADRRVTVEVKLVATKGEYASWRATRASGDFDLRTFSIRAYPVQPVPELRPGMSAYFEGGLGNEAGVKTRILAGRPARVPLAVRRSRGAAFDLRRAAVCVRGSHNGLQPSGHTGARGDGRRRGQVRCFACPGGIRRGLAEPENRRPLRYAVDGRAGHTVGQGDLGNPYPAGLRARPEGPTPPTGRRLL